MFIAKNYAFQIQTTTKAVFNLGEFGLGLITDLEYIEKNPLIPIMTVLGNFYNKVDQTSKMEIDDFIENFYWLAGKSIEEIEEDRLARMIKTFNHIVAKV